MMPLASYAGYTIKGGKLMHVDKVATMSVQEHYSAAIEAYQNKKWEEVVRQSMIVLSNFPSTPFAQEVLFYLGVAHFQIEEYETANHYLTGYLKKQAAPKFFEEAIQYKFQIAERYQKGAKKHILGWEVMPKWVPAREEAIAIYDEVITALPHHELAAQALYGKAKLLLKDEEYKGSIETYQTLIRRFPKHSLAIESYIGIGQVYFVQCQEEYPDQDFIDLVEINLRKFKRDFPQAERIQVAEKMYLDMQEIYASNLYDTGRFYERTKKPQAAYIYYTRILAKYPETKVAHRANTRLGQLKFKKDEVPPGILQEREQMESLPSKNETAPSLLNLPVVPSPVVETEAQTHQDGEIR
jgi:outer membrane protein assembly factor BamD (BamD/ComL family)